MSVIIILILASLAMALLFLGGFIWAVRSGQFEDTLTPSLRLLPDEDRATKPARSPVGFDPNGRDARATRFMGREQRSHDSHGGEPVRQSQLHTIPVPIAAMSEASAVRLVLRRQLRLEGVFLRRP